MIRKLLCGAGALGASMFAATAAWAQEAAEAVADVAAEIVEVLGRFEGNAVKAKRRGIQRGVFEVVVHHAVELI